MLTVFTWLWGYKFSREDVLKLFRGVQRHLKQEHQFCVISENYYDGWPSDVTQLMIVDGDLIRLPGCFARLRMFDPRWIEYLNRNHLVDIDRIACIDLDTVITGPLDPLFDRPESFVIMQKGNASNPCPYNGALMMLRAGVHPEVWNDFSIEAAGRVPFYEFPDDQGWLWHKVPNAAGWMCGVESGVFVFRKPGWPSFDREMKRGADDLPKGARLVTFSGGRSPDKFKHLDWVKENWR